MDSSGRLIESGSVRTDEEIDGWLERHSASLLNVAIDAPLVVVNESGMRRAEKLIGASFGRYDASCHATNTAKGYMNPPRATTLAQRHGWNIDPAAAGLPGQPACIEVYPHPATIGLFNLGRILKYKRGDLATRRAAFTVLLDHVESLSVVGLESSVRWSEIRDVAANSPRQSDLDRIEDEVDAILCAHLAWLWHTNRSALQVYGDVETGYIVAPPPPTHPPTPRAAVAKPAPGHSAPALPLVTFTVHAMPATFATAGELPWREAVTTDAIVAMGGTPAFAGRFSVELHFVLPQPTMMGQGWDLDNLIKPTIDSLAPVIGVRPGQWKFEQADDERVDRIVASKRTANDGEGVGATITVTVLREAD